MLKWAGVLALIIGFAAGTNRSAVAVSDAEAPGRTGVLGNVLDHRYPRLVVVLVFDQLRGDYLTRYSDLFLPAMDVNGSVGGFRYLMERGAGYLDAQYTHLPCHTGPGHATILTGASPSETGIVANDWLTSAGKPVYCAEDPDAKTVGAPGSPLQRGGSSPIHLQASTVGDELRMATNLRSKVVGIAIKDRSAILLAGHNPNACVWFDNTSGNFVTSTYYTTGTLPAFAQRANRQRLADQWIGKSWDYFLPRENYKRSHDGPYPGQGDGGGLGGGFPKKLSSDGEQAGKSYYTKLTFSPFGNEMLFEVARMAIEDEGLGSDTIPDLLCVSFSSNDLIGHAYGPNSTEVQDLMVRTDRQISAFLNYLRQAVSGGLNDALVIITGDHGGIPLPNWATASMRLDAGRAMGATCVNEALAALRSRYPEKQLSGSLVRFDEPYVTLSAPILQSASIDPTEARRVVARRLATMRGAYAVYTRDQIETGQLPRTAIAEMVTNAYNPENSGDLFIVWRPYWFPSGGPLGTSHGGPYQYDTHVPILFAGRGIQPGLYARRVDVKDIAPTLSLLLGISAPSNSRGRILEDMLR